MRFKCFDFEFRRDTTRLWFKCGRMLFLIKLSFSTICLFRFNLDSASLLTILVVLSPLPISGTLSLSLFQWITVSFDLPPEGSA